MRDQAEPEQREAEKHPAGGTHPAGGLQGETIKRLDRRPGAGARHATPIRSDGGDA